jgi:SAM-dependent methyltransferase
VRAGVEDKRVLEIGSLDVNATEQGLYIRDLCEGCAAYHGIDEHEGHGVDEAVGAADYNGKGKYDIVITTEALEHAARPEDIIECAQRALRPGGLLIVTAAGEGRQAHDCDGGVYRGVEPYKNVTRSMLEAWLEEWDVVQVAENTEAHDIYATARKPKAK